MDELSNQLNLAITKETENRAKIAILIDSLDAELNCLSSYTSADVDTLNLNIKKLDPHKKYNTYMNAIYEQYSLFGKSLTKKFDKENSDDITFDWKIEKHVLYTVLT